MKETALSLRSIIPGLIGLAAVILILALSLAHEYGMGLGVAAFMAVWMWIHQQRTETMLIESNERLQGIFESALDGIALVEVDTKRYFTCNPAFSNMLGYTPDEITRLGMADLSAA